MEMKTLTVNGNTYQVRDANAVSFAKAQSLTEDEKLQARQNLGMAEKTYALIEDVTLSEDAASFVRAAEPDGTPYDFSAFRVYMEVPGQADAHATNSQLIFDTYNKNGAFIFHQASGGVSNSDSKTVFVARNDGGLPDYYCVAAPTTAPNTLKQRANEIFEPWGNITKLSMSVYPTTLVLPAGTRIRIYGIRG